MDHKKIKRAEAFAVGAHCGVGQFRKFTGEPYVEHPIRVASLIMNAEMLSTDMVCAALLHDTVEDTYVTNDIIQDLFGARVANFVGHLTKTPKEDFPSYNRQKLKELDAGKLAMAPYEVQTIKYADFIDNAPSLIEYDPEFAPVWIQEKNMAVGQMTRGDTALRNRALAIGV